MKKLFALILAAIMILSFAACGAQTEIVAEETTAPVEATPEATPEPTAEPTVAPTAEPTATPTPELTETEKMFYTWLTSVKEIKMDIYANLVATKAYKDGKLDRLVKNGELTPEYIEMLLGQNTFLKDFYYPVTDNVITNNYNEDDLTPADLAIAILRGDDVKASGENIEKAVWAFEYFISEEWSLISALPEDRRQDVYDITQSIAESINNKKDVSNVEETINSYNLDWQQKWYVFEYCAAWPGISPFVNYNGEQIQFGEYLGRVDFFNDFFPKLKNNLEENYLKEENYELNFFK